MKAIALGLTAATLAIGVASAQVNNPPGAHPGATTAAPLAPTMGGTTGTTTGTGATMGTGTGTGTTNNGRAAASGNSNQAVATTNANAATPAHGANSFTMAEARRRIESKGFANATDFSKDRDGVWRGKAQRNGSPVSVWLDYKGNVGQQ